MVHYRIYENGILHGTMYWFEYINDAIPMHDHKEHGREHNVIVLNGGVEVYGIEKSWGIPLTAGDVFDFNVEHYPHELKATVDNTTILCINIGERNADDYDLVDGVSGTLIRGVHVEPHNFQYIKRLTGETT